MIAEFTFKCSEHESVLKTEATHEDFCKAFKSGYLKEFKLDWIELYCVQDQGIRTVFSFPAREVTVENM